MDWDCALPKKATSYYGNMHRNGKGGGRSDWTWVIAETNSLWLHNEESLCLRSEEEVSVDQLLDQDGSSSSKKVMVGYSMNTRWICSCVPRLSFDGCLLNQQNCGCRRLVRVRFGSELREWIRHLDGIWREVDLQSTFDIVISNYVLPYFYSYQLSDVRIFSCYLQSSTLIYVNSLCN